MIGNYFIGRTLGSGAFATVKAARHKQSNQEVAIKMVNTTTHSSSARTELRIAQKLRHPNIVGLIESFSHREYLCIVLEKVNGVDLYSLIQRSHGGLSEPKLRPLFKQLFEAFTYAHHEQHVTHRDIKPENILVDNNNNIKIIDWGLGALVEVSPLQTFVGSLEYCAPEVLLRKPYDGIKADCWSLGALLYVCLSGRFPWNTETVEQTIHNITTGNIVPFPARVTAETRDLVKNLLQLQPLARFNCLMALQHPWFQSSSP